jgi:hypothetical protein
MRKIVCKFYGVFKSLHKSQQQDYLSFILEYSNAYRKIIEDECGCLAITKQYDEGELALLQNCEAIWYFCEIYILSGANDASMTSVAPFLVKWLNSLPPERCFNPAIWENTESYPTPETSKEYWNYIIHSAIFGDYNVVKYLISLDSRNQEWQNFSDRSEKRRGAENEIHKLYATIDEIMTAVPSNDESSFRVEQFKNWQQAIKEFLPSKFLDPRLKIVFEIFSGNNKVIKENCNNWKEYVTAHVNYCFPEYSQSQLEALFKKLPDTFPECQHDPLFSFYKSIVQKNFRKLFDGVGELGSWWMLSHLSDLFSCARVNVGDFELEKEREEYVSQFARWLSDEGLLTLVPAYLAECPKQGKFKLKDFLQTIPITSEKQASLLLSICSANDLEQVFQNKIKVTVAKQMNDKNQYCGALRWYLDAKELSMASTVSDALLNTIVKRIKECDAPLIKMSVNEMQAKGRIDPTDKIIDANDIEGDSLLQNLQFLDVFHSVVSAYQAEKYDLVQSGLVTLLNGSAPKRFWLSLLLDAKMLIEDKKVIFGPMETSLLMRALDQLSYTLHDEYLFQEGNPWPLIHQNLKNIFTQNYSKSLTKNARGGVGSGMASGVSIY